MTKDHDKLVQLEIKQELALQMLEEIRLNTTSMSTRITKLETYRNATMWIMGLVIPSCIAGYFVLIA